MTPVIFRKFKNGEIIALFPTIGESYHNPNVCMSYLHVGQHGPADICPSYTKPATEDEYKELLDELVDIGYDDLKVVKRDSVWYYNQRVNQLSQLRQDGK